MCRDKGQKCNGPRSPKGVYGTPSPLHQGEGTISFFSFPSAWHQDARGPRARLGSDHPVRCHNRANSHQIRPGLGWRSSRLCNSRGGLPGWGAHWWIPMGSCLELITLCPPHMLRTRKLPPGEQETEPMKTKSRRGGLLHFPAMQPRLSSLSGAPSTSLWLGHGCGAVPSDQYPSPPAPCSAQPTPRERPGPVHHLRCGRHLLVGAPTQHSQRRPQRLSGHLLVSLRGRG